MHSTLIFQQHRSDSLPREKGTNSCQSFYGIRGLACEDDKQHIFKKHVFNLVIFSHMHRATQLQHNTVKRFFNRCGSRNFSKEGGGGEDKNGWGEIFHFLFWKNCMIIYAYKKRENSQKSNKYTRYILATFFAKYFSIPRRINTMDLHVRPQILVSLEQ